MKKPPLQFRVGDLFSDAMMDISALMDDAKISDRERRLMTSMVYQLSKKVRAEIKEQEVVE